jgi:hypothetical protein
MTKRAKIPASRPKQAGKGNGQTLKNPRDAQARPGEKSSAPAVGRDAAGRFIPGTSGNPLGTKVKVPEELRHLAQTYCAEGIERLVFWMRGNDPQASLMATKLLLDRGLGKSAQPLVGAGGQSLVSITMNSGAIVDSEDAARVYAEICGNPSIDISALTFAAPAPSQATEAVAVAHDPLAPLATEADERHKLWLRLGEEK